MTETAAEKKARRKAEKEEKLKAKEAAKKAAARTALDEAEDEELIIKTIPLHELNNMAYKSHLSRNKAEEE